MLLHKNLEEKMMSSFFMENCFPNSPFSYKNFLMLEKAEIAELQKWALREGLMMSEVASVRI